MNNIIPHKLWTVRLNFNKKICGDLPEKLSDALEDVVHAVMLHNTESVHDGDNWEITLTTLGEPNLDEILNAINGVEAELLSAGKVVAEKLPETDWLQQVHKDFPPVTIGKFFVYGSHYEGDTPEGLIPLQIDAATAFGSGEHETTKGCILALEYLLEKENCDFSNALDMGCGSGILAIAVAKLWPNVKISAVDIDPESVIVTDRHVKMNDVESNITSEMGDGYNTALAKNNTPYDIVVANILSSVLIEMAAQLSQVVKIGGYCVLSGLLLKQKADVIKAHEDVGFELVHAEEIGEWQALVMKKIS